MKYILVILLGALVIGLLLSLAVAYLFGSDAGHFFARFIAGPAGLVISFVLFIAYDTLWPRNKGDS